VQVERAHAHIGGGRDVGDLGRVQALLREHPGGRAQEVLAGPLLAALEPVGLGPKD
jgi:hypothetical protein